MATLCFATEGTLLGDLMHLLHVRRSIATQAQIHTYGFKPCLNETACVKRRFTIEDTASNYKNLRWSLRFRLLTFRAEIRNIGCSSMLEQW